MALTEGDIVIVPLMPELGVGIIDMVVPPPFDCLVVSFEVDGRPYENDFGVGEVEPARPTVKRTA